MTTPDEYDHDYYGAPPRADVEFAALVKLDVFDDTTPEQAAWLRSPPILESFWNELRRIIDGIDSQLALHNAEGGSPDDPWRHGALKVRGRCSHRMHEIRPAVKALRREQHRSER